LRSRFHEIIAYYGAQFKQQNVVTITEGHYTYCFGFQLQMLFGKYQTIFLAVFQHHVRKKIGRFVIVKFNRFSDRPPFLRYFWSDCLE